MRAEMVNVMGTHETERRHLVAGLDSGRRHGTKPFAFGDMIVPLFGYFVCSITRHAMADAIAYVSWWIDVGQAGRKW